MEPHTTETEPTQTRDRITRSRRASAWRLDHLFLIVGLWLIIFVSALWKPPLLDDADATHAQAAQTMLTSGDWVTLHVDGIRYLEKPPLPYWMTAVSLWIFSPPGADSRPQRTAAFAVHLPLALTVLALALLGYSWSRRAFAAPAFGENSGLYTAIFVLTSAGVFLFTRVFIPDALLSLLLALCLYSYLRSLERCNHAEDGSTTGQNSPTSRVIPHLWPYVFWLALALAVLAKGLVALVFVFGTVLVFSLWTRTVSQWRRLRPLSGTLLFLLIASPWHILAGLRNTGGANGHGFFWFYFVNEHLLRFLGRRIPRDYNKLPAALYWSLHIVWLFPWSLFAPIALLVAWRRRADWFTRSAHSFRRQTVLMLTIFSAIVLVFFSISTNQEYYTFPVYLPLLMLLAASICFVSEGPIEPTMRRAFTSAFAALLAIGFGISAALAYGLWSSRRLPFVSDIGDLLAHRGVGEYTLSMSHFFDLTGPSFAALRLPAALALVAFVVGPVAAWYLYAHRRLPSALMSVAAMSTVFLVAAHIALVRFGPMLSSANFARRIETLERTHAISANTQVLLFGDQAYGSSIPFYLDRRVLLVDGRTTSMLFGSTFTDAPHIFLSSAQLKEDWGVGPRKILFVPAEQQATVDQLLGSKQIVLKQTSGKELITDRPLETR